VYYSNDPQKFTYLTPPEAVPGRAYWAEFEEGKIFKMVGYPVATEEYGGVKYYSIPLSRGWNMVGCPSPEPVEWDLESIKVRLGTGQPIPLRQALNTVSGYAWGWTGNDYGLIYDTSVEAGVWKTYLELLEVIGLWRRKIATYLYRCLPKKRWGQKREILNHATLRSGSVK
jgi:hypothetical protein